MEQATRFRFLNLLGESLQAVLDYEQPTGAVSVRLHVRDGEPWAASVALDEKEGE